MKRNPFDPSDPISFSDDEDFNEGYHTIADGIDRTDTYDLTAISDELVSYSGASFLQTGLEGFLVYMMQFKSMVGIGIFILPFTVSHIGLLGFAIFYPLICCSLSYFMLYAIKAADIMDYDGDSLGGLHDTIF